MKDSVDTQKILLHALYMLLVNKLLMTRETITRLKYLKSLLSSFWYVLWNNSQILFSK